jgi:hypothetical protein
MDQSTSWKGFALETPATYRIRVQGRLDKNWSNRLAGMSITEETTVPNSRVSILAGHLIDQAELSGVLNALYDLRLTILSVENLDEQRV